MKASSFTRILTGVGITVVTIVGGYALGHAFHDDAKPKADAPKTTPAIPVLKLAGVGPDAPGATTVPVTDGTSPTTTTAPSSSGAVPYSGVVREVSSNDKAVDPGKAAAGSAIKRPSDAAGTPELLAAPIPGASSDHFGDPCAPESGDAPSGADCPGGMMSTILFDRAPAPLDLVAPPHPQIPGTVPGGSWVECSTPTVGTVQTIGISSNNPLAEGSLTWWKSTDYAHRRTIHFSTSAADRAAFDEWFATSGGYDIGHRLQHCVPASGLERGAAYQYRVEATDVFGSAATWQHEGFYASEDRPRPPTVVGPWQSDLLVVGWSKPATELRAIAYPLEPGQAADSACQTMRTSGSGGADVRGTTAIEVNSRTVPASELAAAGYTYDPGYNKVTSMKFTDLLEGTRYSVCVTRVLASAPSYDRARAADSEALGVTTPNRMRPKVSLVATDMIRGASLQAGVTSPGHDRDWCPGGVGIGDLAVGHTDFSPPDAICDFGIGYASMQRFSDGMDLRLNLDVDHHAIDSTFRLPVDNPACNGPCAPRATEWYRVPLPEGRVGSGLCGGSWGDCDPPTDMRSAGTALIRVDFTDGASDGGASWDVADPEQVTTTPLPGSPDVPRLDAYTEVTVSGELAPTLTVPVHADRAVSASVEFRDIGGGAPCLVDPSAPATYDDATVTEFHSFTIPGVCAGKGYELVATITDAAGHAAVYGGEGGMAWWAGGRVFTPPIDTAVDVRVTVGPFPNAGDGAKITGFNAVINRLSAWFPGGDPTGCVGDTTTNAVYNEEYALGDSNDIVIGVSARGDRVTRGGSISCTDTSSSWDGGEVVLRATVSYNDLIRGTVTLRSAAGDAFPVEATITVHPLHR